MDGEHVVYRDKSSLRGQGKPEDSLINIVIAIIIVAEVLLNACKNIGLAVNTRKTKYMEIGYHAGTMANEHIMLDSNSYEKVGTFKYLDSFYN